MADRVMPFVRLILPIRRADSDPVDGSWRLTDPVVIASPSVGKPFPFRMPELWVYVQLTGGLGLWELGVEARQKRDDGTYRFIGIGAMTSLDFEPGPRLPVKAIAFKFLKLPFREEGLYEFRVVAQTSEIYTTPTFEALNGPVAELRVLDHRRTL